MVVASIVVCDVVLIEPAFVVVVVSRIFVDELELDDNVPV